MKAVEGLKAAAVVLILLFACIIALWITTQLRRPEDPLPDLTPRPAKEMWEHPPARR
jgi:hypothetical protein